MSNLYNADDYLNKAYSSSPAANAAGAYVMTDARGAAYSVPPAATVASGAAGASAPTVAGGAAAVGPRPAGMSDYVVSPDSPRAAWVSERSISPDFPRAAGMSEYDDLMGSIDFTKLPFVDCKDFDGFIKTISSPEFAQVASYYAEASEKYATLDHIKSSEARNGRKAAIDEELRQKYGGEDFRKILDSPVGKKFEEFTAKMSAVSPADRVGIYQGLKGLSQHAAGCFSDDTKNASVYQVGAFKTEMINLLDNMEVLKPSGTAYPNYERSLFHAKDDTSVSNRVLHTDYASGPSEDESVSIFG